MASSSTPRPRPLGSLLASAQRITQKSFKRAGHGASNAWQVDSWEMFNLIGELRFMATTLSGRGAKAKIYVGEQQPDPTEDPVPVEDSTITSILTTIGSGPSGLSQLVDRLYTNLFIAGEGWLVGIPRHLLPPSLLPPTLSEDPNAQLDLLLAQDVPLGTSIDDLEWRMLSVSEVSSSTGGDVALKFGPGEAERVVCSPDDIFLIRVWRPHPEKWWEPDSPTRSSLPIMRELVGLSMKNGAEVDSRLAGAGVFIVPQSAQRALNIAAGRTDDEDSADELAEALMEAMGTAIRDRSSASALVPLILTVPDEVTEKFHHITFATPLDGTAGARIDQAIRRIALGLDAPPELLLGVANMNHWGAWLTDQQTVAQHIEPTLALVCDALTTQYLWPVLIDQGMAEEQARKYVVWYDVSHLVVRPNRTADAKEAHAAGVISDEAYRNAAGFDESEAPAVKQEEDTGNPVIKSLPPESALALELVKEHPQLTANPGLPGLVAQIRAVLRDEIPILETPTAQVPTKNGVPQLKVPALGPKPQSVPGGVAPAPAPPPEAAPSNGGPPQQQPTPAPTGPAAPAPVGG